MNPFRINTIAAWVLAFVCLAAPARGRADNHNLRKLAIIKAAFIRYIAEFSRWPDSAFATSTSPIRITVVGDDPYGVHEILTRAIEAKRLQIKGRPIVVTNLTYVPKPEEDAATVSRQRRDFHRALQVAHVAFLTESCKRDWADIRSLLREQPVMLLGEFEGFAKSGGMCEFVTYQPTNSRNVKIHLHLNLQAVAKAQLVLSSRLLGLRNVVRIIDASKDSDFKGSGRHLPFTYCKLWITIQSAAQLVAKS